MLTMMTNYTNHNYNSNNDDDNISITIILWINFNPFRCTGSFRWPWVQKYMHWQTCGCDWPWQELAHKDQLEPFDRDSSMGGRGWGDYTGAWGASEGGSGSVERDRQNRDLYSNWTKCCENPANRSEQVQQNRWFLSTLCMTDNNTVLTSTTLHSTFLFWDFGFSLHCRALQRSSHLRRQRGRMLLSFHHQAQRGGIFLVTT